MAEVTVGIDIGTTSVKALAADGDGNVVARARVPHPLAVPTGDAMEHDANRAWRRGPRRALAALGDVRARGLCVAAMVPSVTAVDHDLLPRVLDGDVTGTVAMAGADGVWAPNHDPTKTFVPEAHSVDHIAVVGAGPSVMVAGRLPARHVATVDTTRRLAEVDTTSAGAGMAVSPDAIRDVLERAYVALAAEMMGTARWLLEATLAYAKSREQFGRPIGAFQAIQHKLANVALAYERGWSAVYYAAMAIDSGDPDRHRAAHVAKAAAGTAATLAAKDGIQVHGGIGYTWEHDLHLFIRRAYGSEHLLGTSGWHHDRLGELLVEPAAR